jgi:hypothetical protein
MDRQHVDLVVADQPVDDPVRTAHDFPNEGIFEFWNRSAGFWEWNQSIGRCDEPGNDDGCEVRRVLTDERANRSQVGLRLLRPQDLSHDKNCF